MKLFPPRATQTWGMGECRRDDGAGVQSGQGVLRRKSKKVASAAWQDWHNGILVAPAPLWPLKWAMRLWFGYK